MMMSVRLHATVTDWMTVKYLFTIPVHLLYCFSLSVCMSVCLSVQKLNNYPLTVQGCGLGLDVSVSRSPRKNVNVLFSSRSQEADVSVAVWAIYVSCPRPIFSQIVPVH